MEFEHITVLLEETVGALNVDVNPNGNYIDATLGGAGHSRLLLSRLGPEGHLYSFDQDKVAIDNAISKGLDNRWTLIHDNFANLAEHGLPSIDGILYDLGVSSPQFDVAERGFSYKLDSKLDMRMDQSTSLTAYEIVNTYPFNNLMRIFSRYGEEPFSKQIARKIEQVREIKPIETTTELADLIKSALPQKALKKKGHPAKRVFQALRIEVNDELGSLEKSLNSAIGMLSPGGRIAVISFQSLEDRIVKRIFKENSEVNVPHGLPMIPDEMKAKLKVIVRKPILASESELEINNRAHSAKLRVAERT
ncbi:MAG TPA: 16S rRNA (cytosine(1402)-N(4))-methyltransferase RsmH [Lactovum miscens]|uniref:16S rRNA (cytosine(1402)-N(4))-methyltransferase RsmH n=1 Tax=Lactovum miscens TaxID=190387 RepID=UPI002ED7ADCE